MLMCFPTFLRGLGYCIELLVQKQKQTLMNRVFEGIPQLHKDSAVAGQELFWELEQEGFSGVNQDFEWSEVLHVFSISAQQEWNGEAVVLDCEINSLLSSASVLPLPLYLSNCELEGFVFLVLLCFLCICS